MDNFCTRLKEERLKKGLTQNKLAEILDIDRTSISKYENGKQLPELYVLNSMADLFGVSLDYMAGRSHNVTPCCHNHFDEMESPKIFGEILRALREERNISQKDMADHLQISRQAYNYYELGKREPSYEALRNLARYFGVTADYLLGLSDSRITVDTSHPNDPSTIQVVNDLSKESKKELNQYIQFLKFKDELDKGKSEIL